MCCLLANEQHESTEENSSTVYANKDHLNMQTEEQTLHITQSQQYTHQIRTENISVNRSGLNTGTGS